MGNPVVSADFVRLLDKRLREVGEDKKKYAELSAMIPKIFRTLPSDSAWEEFFSIGSLPDIPEFTGKLSYLGVSPGYHIKIEPGEFAGGVQVERKFLDDKKYSVFDDRAGAIMTSAMRTKEKKAVRVFANAFSTAYDFMTNEEGVALCSDSHTTKAGTSTTNGFDNAGTSAMSKVSVAATRILMRKFRNSISERIEMPDDLALIYPDDLDSTAREIVGTQKGYDTAAQNINPEYQRYELIPYMRLSDSSTKNWFMVSKSMMKDSLIWIDRIAPDLNTTIDFETLLTKISLYMRMGYGYLDWRWIYGHNVT